jgi:hypothetical protein
MAPSAELEDRSDRQTAPNGRTNNPLEERRLPMVTPGGGSPFLMSRTASAERIFEGATGADLEGQPQPQGSYVRHHTPERERAQVVVALQETVKPLLKHQRMMVTSR